MWSLPERNLVEVAVRSEGVVARELEAQVVAEVAVRQEPEQQGQEHHEERHHQREEQLALVAVVQDLAVWECQSLPIDLELDLVFFSHTSDLIKKISVINHLHK